MMLERRTLLIVVGAVAVIVALVSVALLSGILRRPAQPPQRVTDAMRLDAIPANNSKMVPADDHYKPVSLSPLWETPAPMPGPVNSAGAEDSPFMIPNGTAFYFFFTPDVKVPVEKQVLDGVTGIWWTRMVNGSWTAPEKVVLSPDYAMDGCEFVQNDTMWFASVRAGNYREIDIYTARLVDGAWTDVQNAGPELNRDYTTGEFHLTSDWNTLYFGANLTGTYGGNDLWVMKRIDGRWNAPVNLGPVVNGGMDEMQPCLSENGMELWFTRWSAHGYAGPSCWRSARQANGSWGAPEEVFANFAGEPTLDAHGNVYFTHHFYEPPGTMLEADIYYAHKK